MNFKITHNWLLEYIDTDASPEEIQKYLSLSAVNVETLEEVGDDYVYDIEVTSNRIDAASVAGFARECVAVLPHYGKKATFKQNAYEKTFGQDLNEKSKKVDIQIKNDETVSRVAAVIMKNVKVGPAPDHIAQRIKACGERPINNVVDISNYFRIALGQPIHIFDYDSIEGGVLSIEKSKKGDKIKLIDDKELELPGDDVIIRDGKGRIIDLVGHMGGKNTEVSDKTKNILVFIPVVNKVLVRKTSMKTGHRTPSISYFEKGLDERRVEPTFMHVVNSLKKNANAIVSSKLFDFYPEPYKGMEIDVDADYVCSLMNTEIKPEEMIKMIEPLGFISTLKSKNAISVEVPSFRAKDVSTQADIAEEIARIFGYHNIKPEIQKTDIVYQPLDVKALFDAKEKVRDYLASIGFNEQYNYSMISEKQVQLLDKNVEDHLKLTNTISRDIEYMRTSLTPSLLKNVADNQARRDKLQFFELARVYKKRDGDLPYEEERLCIVTHDDFLTLKGTLENILKLLRVKDVGFAPADHVKECDVQAQLVDISGKQQKNFAHIGVIKESYQLAHGIKQPVAIAEIRFKDLVEYIDPYPKYVKPSPFAHIKLDHTYVSDKEHIFVDIQDKAHKTSVLLQDIQLIDKFKDRITLRFIFAADDRNITEEEAKTELEKIVASF